MPAASRGARENKQQSRGPSSRHGDNGVPENKRYYQAENNICRPTHPVWTREEKQCTQGKREVKVTLGSASLGWSESSSMPSMEASSRLDTLGRFLRLSTPPQRCCCVNRVDGESTVDVCFRMAGARAAQTPQVYC